MVLVRATTLDDWQEMRDIRLEALRDALYERCGFTVTPERQPLPSDPALGEVGMTRPL